MPDGLTVTRSFGSSVYKVPMDSALYDVDVPRSGDVRVSSRGQMSLPAEARHRWGLDGGGELGYVDLGGSILLVPGGVQQLRQELLSAITPAIWRDAAGGFGDPELADQ